MQLKIAVVEDDTILREELIYFLRENEFEVVELITGLALDETLRNQTIDLIILDLNLPGLSGFEIATNVKSRYPHVGIVMLTARTSLPDRIKSYDSGADIYLPKPTSPSEILAAVNSLGRRLTKAQNQGWLLDLMRSTIQKQADSVPIVLTSIELNLIDCLMRAPDKMLDTESICERLSVTARDHHITRRALENLISRLRKKLAIHLPNDSESIIRSVRGIGYQLCQPVSVVS